MKHYLYFLLIIVGILFITNIIFPTKNDEINGKSLELRYKSTDKALCYLFTQMKPQVGNIKKQSSSVIKMKIKKEKDYFIVNGGRINTKMRAKKIRKINTSITSRGALVDTNGDIGTKGAILSGKAKGSPLLFNFFYEIKGFPLLPQKKVKKGEKWKVKYFVREIKDIMLTQPFEVSVNFQYHGKKKYVINKYDLITFYFSYKKKNGKIIREVNGKGEWYFDSARGIDIYQHKKITKKEYLASDSKESESRVKVYNSYLSLIQSPNMKVTFKE